MQPRILYSMTNSELINRCYELEAFFLRDVVELSSCGIDVIRIDGLKLKRSTFQEVPTDATMKALISIEIDNRNVSVKLLKANMTEIVGIARNQLGAKTSDFDTFGNVEFSNMSIPTLCISSLIIAARANYYFAKLQPKGLTTTMITDIAVQKKEVETGIKHVSDAKGNQKLTTTLRRNTGNDLFLEMKDMCSSARGYLENKNAIRADDYVLYDYPANIQVRNGLVNPGETVCRAIEGNLNDSLFRLQVREGEALEFYFSDTEEGVAATTKVTLQPNFGVYEDNLPTNLGFDEIDGFTFFCMHNPSSTVAASYRVYIEGK